MLRNKKMCPGGPCEDADGPVVYDHPRGTGGMGGSPCKFRKREGGLEDRRVIHGENCKSCMDSEVAEKGRKENFD